jgi:hypothetical protein
MLNSNFFFQLFGISRSGQDKIWFRRKPLLKRFVILAALNIAASANPISAQTTVLKLDCGENKTILARKLDQPQPSQELGEFEIDWGAIAKDSRSSSTTSIDNDSIGKPKEPTVELIEGCALEQGETNGVVTEQEHPSNIVVLETSQVSDNRSDTDISETNSLSLSMTSALAAKGIVGKKEDIGNRTLNPTPNGPSKWLAISMAFVAILTICRRFIYGLAQATFIHKKKCKISATLTTDFAEFDGDIVILGKLGCHFAPKNMDTLRSIEALLGPTEFHRFSISTDSNQRPVFVNAVENLQVPVFFTDRLKKSELKSMLRLSTVKVQYASWRPAKTGPRNSKEVISARLKRLADLRDEEIRHKLMSSSD